MERFTQHDFQAIFEFLRTSHWIPDLKAFVGHVLSALPNNVSLGVASQKEMVPPAPSRSRADHSEGDGLLLNGLRPPVLHAYRDAEATSRMRTALAGAKPALDQLRVGVIVLAPDGGVLFANVRARTCLLDYFEGGSVDRLPKVIQRWIRHHEARLRGRDAGLRASEPLIVEREGTRLAVGLLSNAAQSLLILEEQPDMPRELLAASLGLTVREAEVLTWVAEGKTNLAVAAILRISGRTVQKHLERTYVKLGVETRTAAAAQALRTMRGYAGLVAVENVRDTALSWTRPRSRGNAARIGRGRRSGRP
jgi:DNA-binding CsgD family transcriptional regulator